MPVKKKRKRAERPVFDSIRKPTAPPSKRIGQPVPEEKLRPSLRKAKHKKEPETDE
jgi:hypothetical protein